MAAPNIDELLVLDVETRLALVQQLWDSIVADATDDNTLPPSSEERALLEQRLKEDDDDPDAAVPWSVVRDELHRDR
jgi:putative addiction module component (TIGR02574 family)